MRAQLLLAVSRNIQRSRPATSLRVVPSGKTLSSFTKTPTRTILPVASRLTSNMADDQQIDVKSFTDRAEKAVFHLYFIDSLDVLFKKEIDYFSKCF